jgi:hypothetical protein
MAPSYEVSQRSWRPARAFKIGLLLRGVDDKLTSPVRYVMGKRARSSFPYEAGEESRGRAAFELVLPNVSTI